MLATKSLRAIARRAMSTAHPSSSAKVRFTLPLPSHRQFSTVCSLLLFVRGALWVSTLSSA